MAAVMSVARLIDLLRASESGGRQLTWIDPSLGLVVAPDLVSRGVRIDFASETMTALPSAPDCSDVAAGSASAHSEPPAPTPKDDRQGQEGRALACSAPPAPPPSHRPSDAAVRRPAPDGPPAAPAARFGGRRTGQYCLTLEGRRIYASSQKQLLLVGVETIEALRGGTLEKLAREKSRTKRLVARSREALNDNAALAAAFSEPIDGGWWVFTNNNFSECTKFLLRAAFHAGLHASVEKLA